MVSNFLKVKYCAISLLTLFFLLTQGGTISMQPVALDGAVASQPVIVMSQPYTNMNEASLVSMANSGAVKQSVDYNTISKNYNVKVFINSKYHQVEFTADSGRPFIALGRTFVPYRILAEKMYAKVSWDGNKRQVTAVSKDKSQTVNMFIGNAVYSVNGENKQMDVEPFILSAESRTYIPARYLTEGLGYTIDFTKAADNSEVMYIVSFTEGQNEQQRQKALDEIAQIPSGEQVDPMAGIPVTSADQLTPEVVAKMQDVKAEINFTTGGWIKVNREGWFEQVTGTIIRYYPGFVTKPELCIRTTDGAFIYRGYYNNTLVDVQMRLSIDNKIILENVVGVLNGEMVHHD